MKFKSYENINSMQELKELSLKLNAQIVRIPFCDSYSFMLFKDGLILSIKKLTQ